MRELGVSHGAAWQLVQRGWLEHVGHRVYRIEGHPVTTAGGFLEAVLLVGDGAYLVDTGTLSLTDLGLVVPERVRVGTPRRVRTRLPEWIEIVRDDHDPALLTTVDGVPTVAVHRAILESRGRVMTERLVDAALEAYDKGLITLRERYAVLVELRGPPEPRQSRASIPLKG